VPTSKTSRRPHCVDLDMDEYDKICEWFVTARRPNIGIAEIAEFTQFLVPGARILELGCGHGKPLSEYLINAGFDLHVIDSSATMIEKFRENFPDVPYQNVTIQDSDFFNTSFDAVIAWGVLFHLSRADQEIAISKVSRTLKPAGTFLFTAGKDQGTHESPMNDVDFRYLSLGSELYARILERNGMRLLDEYYDEWQNYYYIAQNAV